MKILVIAGHPEANIKGGASKSIANIVNSLKDIKNIQIKILTQTFQNKILKFLVLDSYILIPKIIKTILKFKPNIIITQDRIAFPTILISKLMNIPIIHIVRSMTDFCPKHVDVIGYGKACSGIYNRKQCFKCIDKWRSLRVLIGNKQRGSEYSIKTSLSNILYKIRYFICLFNLYLMKKANINLVASKLMKFYFSGKIRYDKIKIINITPIRKYGYKNIPYMNKLKQLIFIRTHYDASHKGMDFILRLSKYIPEMYDILVVGGCENNWKGTELDNIINIEFISSKSILDIFFNNSTIALVPTFCTEAFGRIIPESLINKTPVISSPQCGANQFFENKDFLKVVPLKLNLWIKAIENFIIDPPIINNNDIKQIYKQFSLNKSKKDFIKIIKEVLIN